MFGIQPGQMIDEYKIIGKIGKGGMATVYKAYQVSMDRYVAIKILSFQLIDNEEFLGRFKQEARLIARLEHTNILPVYAYGEDHGIPYLVMRFLNAGTLKDYLESRIPQKEGKARAVGDGYIANGYIGEVPIANNPEIVPNPAPLSLKEIDSIFSQLVDALSYAHENGVIHRDIKPSNVLLNHRGTVFLTDFGIAKLIESAMGRKETVPQFTATGAITGTPDYMSPEQAQGLRLDQRSDIYSLGIVLYEMLTGKVPFDAETPIAVIMKQISEPLPPPSRFNPSIHPALESVVVKALEKSPADRYSSMQEFLFAWNKALAVMEPASGGNVVDGYIGDEYIGETPSVGAVLYGKPPTPANNRLPDNNGRKNLSPYPKPEKPSPIPATPAPAAPAGGALHALEDDSFSGVNTPPGIKSPNASSSSPSSQAWSSAAVNSSSMNNALPSPSTLEEDNKFLLKNLQLSKMASSREGMGGQEHRFASKTNRASEASQAHQSSKHILLIAGGVALAILVIIGLAAALNLFDFIRQARQIPVGWIIR